jgi:hypothetical protein
MLEPEPTYTTLCGRWQAGAGVLPSLQSSTSQTGHGTVEVQHRDVYNRTLNKFVSAERVLKGCFSEALGDLLIDVALGDEVQAAPSWGEMLWIVACVVLPGLVVGLCYHGIPLNPPQSGPDVNFMLLVFTQAFIGGFGLNFVFALVLFSKATPTSAFKSGLICALAFIGTLFTLGSLWLFPTPMGYIWAASVGIPVTLLFAMHDAFGLRAAFGANVRRKLLPPLLLGLLPVAFLLVFSMYRVVFSRLPPSHQTYVAPLWPFIKIAFKVAAVKIVERANNPDLGPCMLFAFDAMAAMSSNFLFLSAAEADSVFAMISVDLVENLAMAINVILLINRHHRAVEEKERAKLVARVDALERERAKLAARADASDARVDALEGRARKTASQTNGEAEMVEDIVNEAAPLVGTVEATADHETVLLLHKAVRLLLSFIASECAEVLASTWAMIMIRLFYFGVNKEWLYVIQDMDDAAFQKAFQFSMLDAGMQLVTLVGLTTYLRINTGLCVLEVGLACVRKQELHAAMLFTSALIAAASFAFFVVHHGVDPTFQFDYDVDMGTGHNSTEFP